MTGPRDGQTSSLIDRLRRRKIVQWALAYLAGAWLALQILDLLAEKFSLPPLVEQAALVLLAVGFLAALVVGWFQGEKGEQRTTTVEILMLAALALLAAAAVALVGRDGSAPGPAASAVEPASAAPPAASLVVLPFQNVGADPENEYFSDGLTEELIVALSRLPGLRVAPRTSSFAFKGQQVPVDSIARRLNVAHVLDGSVRTSKGRLRITAQLVHAENGALLWSERYDRDLADVFAVQEDISHAIVGALELQLGAAGTRAASQATPDMEAYDLYLRGRFLYKRSGEADVAQAIGLFQQALERDPGYAAAWVGLADAYTMQANWAYAAPREVFPKAKEAVLRALELAPEMAEAHATHGHLLRWWDHDRPAARQAFETALHIRPDYPEAHQFYAWFVLDEGRFEEAVSHMRRAQELDRMSAVMSAQVGVMLYYAGRYEEAAAQARRTQEMDPAEFEALYTLSLAEWRLGERTEPITRLERAVQQDRSTWLLAYLGELYAASGRREEALGLLRELEERSRRGYEPIGALAYIHLALGDMDRALDLLEEAYEQGSLWPEVGVDPDFASLRPEPRFQALLGKLGLR